MALPPGVPAPPLGRGPKPPLGKGPTNDTGGSLGLPEGRPGKRGPLPPEGRTPDGNIPAASEDDAAIIWAEFVAVSCRPPKLPWAATTEETDAMSWLALLTWALPVGMAVAIPDEMPPLCIIPELAPLDAFCVSLLLDPPLDVCAADTLLAPVPSGIVGKGLRPSVVRFIRGVMTPMVEGTKAREVSGAVRLDAVEAGWVLT